MFTASFPIEAEAACIDDDQWLTATAQGAPFRLGMPHMDAHGASRGWLLREACHIHWCRIAAQIGVWPSGFRDRSGARVLASVVACSVNGDASAFREDDEVHFVTTEPPRAENGWRSQLDLLGHCGASLRAEIMTAFVRRKGPSNTDLEAADLEPHFTTMADAPDARRAAVIRRLGKADLQRAKADSTPPHIVIPIHESAHIDGVGLLSFAGLHDMIDTAERNAVPHLMNTWPLRDRRVHYAGNLDAGDRLEITSNASAQALSPRASVVVRSHARRTSDGHVIAVAESTYWP